MGGLANLRCTFRRPWGAHAALYLLPSCRLTSPMVDVARGLVSQPGLQNASRHRHLGAHFAAVIVEGEPAAAAIPIPE